MAKETKKETKKTAKVSEETSASGILQRELDFLAAQAKKLKVSSLSGAAALAKDDKPRGRNFAETLFSDGDVVEVPAYPDKDNPKDSDAQWVALPMTATGDPILRVLCKVTNGKVTTYKQLFCGTLTKSVTNRENGASVSVSGTLADEIADCVTNIDVWKKVAGRTLTFVSHEDVPIVQRGFGGDPDRNKSAMVFSIDID